jgi:hypothetical protein
VLKFPAMVNQICDALLEHDGSGRQAMPHAEERDELEAAQQAVYGKLHRLRYATMRRSESISTAPDVSTNL